MKSVDPNELVLEANHQSILFDTGMADEVIIRQPKTRAPDDRDGFGRDPWANLASTSSLMPESSAKVFDKERYSLWNRNQDRIFFLTTSRKLATEPGRALLLALGQRIDRTKLLKGIVGYRLTDQFFPPGYFIHDPQFKPETKPIDVPTEFTKRPLRVVCVDGRLRKELSVNFESVIHSATGQTPQIKWVPLNRLPDELKASDFDLRLVNLSINDPDADGVVSFVFSANPPWIFNGSGALGNYQARIAKARALPEQARNSEYRQVFSDSVHGGSILPLFHFSSIAYARGGIDLSGVPTADETVAFAKVRFK